MEDTCVVCLEHAGTVKPRHFMPCRCVCAVCDMCMKNLDKCVSCRTTPPLPWLRLSEHTAHYIDMLMRRMEVMNGELQQHRREVRRRARVNCFSLILAFLIGMLVQQVIFYYMPRRHYMPVEPKPLLPRDVCGSSDTSSICLM